MKASTDFLQAIGHTEKVFIRCLSPKNTPTPELQARGMTWVTKEGAVNKCTIDGYIELQSGQFHQKYGDKYKPVTDGWGQLHRLNQQGYGIYFVVGHGGRKASEITHGWNLFHESDSASIAEQLIEIDRISSEFGKPTAVLQTKKSVHAYWTASEPISIEVLPNLQKRWLQSVRDSDKCLVNPDRIMRLPGFDHVSWNSEMGDFDRVPCELLQLNDVTYSIEQFDSFLPVLAPNVWTSSSPGIVEGEASDMLIFAQYLEGYKDYGREGSHTAKCPAHDGESLDGLHIKVDTGGFICHGGCSSSAVYHAAAVAFANGYRVLTTQSEASPTTLGGGAFETELSENLKESIKLKNGKAPNLFGGELGKLLSIAADNFNIPVEILNFCLLPVLGSRIDARTKLLISPGTNFTVPAIRWCGLVGDTGSKKSPVISLLTDPLSRHQVELYNEYKERNLDYDAALTAWKNIKPADRDEQPLAPVPMLDLYFSNFTIEALVDSIQHHPNSGTMVMLDELAQFYKSLDMYRGGKGSDRQQWLTIYNGSSIKNNRKSSGAIVIPQTSIGILGGIQPETIANMVSGDDSQFDGLWNRFSFVGLPQFKTSAFTETPADLGVELDKVYRSLSEQPHQTHWLSIESKPLWEAWHDEIEDKILSGSTGLIKGTYSKFHGIAGRNALILHRTLAAIAGTAPEQLISLKTLELAIAWTKWELSQTLLQYQLLGLTNDPELSRILKFIDKFTGKGWVTVRDVRN